MEDDESLTELSHKINSGYIEIEKNHFSNYAVIEINDEENEDAIVLLEDENKQITTKEEIKVENPKIGFGLQYGIIGIIILAECGSCLYIKKYNKFPKIR